MSAVRQKRGSILLAVLWVTAGVAVLVAATLSSSRDQVMQVTNALDAERGRFLAEGCLQVERSTADNLMQRGIASQESVWQSLDTLLRSAPVDTSCRMNVEPAGLRLDVNQLDEERLAYALAAGWGEGFAESAAAVLDWSDTNELERPGGAERPWYVGHSRRSPSNRPFGDVRELTMVRGLEHLTGPERIFSAEPGRVDLGRAGRDVLIAVKGMSPELADALLALRGSQARPVTLDDALAMLGEAQRTVDMRQIAELKALTTPTPDAWIVTAAESVGLPPLVTRVEERWTVAGGRIAVQRHRELP